MDKIPHTCISNPDKDKDGIPDQCELLWGLDLNDPQDAYEDPDNDSLNNKEEYAVSLRFNRTGLCTEASDINNPDTDGDGFKDGYEVERGYDPKNKNSHPPHPDEEDPACLNCEVDKTPIIAIIFLILGIVLVLGGGGYIGYEKYHHPQAPPRQEQPRQMFAPSPPTPGKKESTPVTQEEPQLSREDFLARRRIAKEREALRKKMRSSLMSKFSDEEVKRPGGRR
jgi:hypothetical protein